MAKGETEMMLYEEIQDFFKYFFKVSLHHYQIVALEEILNGKEEGRWIFVPQRVHQKDYEMLRDTLKDIKTFERLVVDTKDECGYCGEEHKGKCLNKKKVK